MLRASVVLLRTFSEEEDRCCTVTAIRCFAHGIKEKDMRQVFSCVLQTVNSGTYPTIISSHTLNNCTFWLPKNAISMQ